MTNSTYKTLVSLFLIASCSTVGKVTPVTPSALPSAELPSPSQSSPPQQQLANPDAVIIFNAEVNDDSVDMAIAIMSAQRAAGAKQIRIILNSPGGIVQSGLKMVIAMENMGIPVIATADGMCASMCYYILQAADRRQMTRRATLLLHNELFTHVLKPVRELKIIVKKDRIDEEAFNNFMAHRLKISRKEMEKRIAAANGEYTMGFQEALDIGAVDEIVDPIRAPGAFLISDVKKGLQE
jgi:ATP-dependent protease ClpP protease subunit